MIFLYISVFLILTFSSAEANPVTDTEREDKQVAGGIFNVVTFPNLPCRGTNGYNGTCMSKTECMSTGGSIAGGCAQGFGSCCFYYTESCGSDIIYNQTYVRNSGFPNTYEASTTYDCEWKIYPQSDDICAIRFDFDVFTLGPPKHLESTTFSCAAGSTDVVKFENAGNQFNYFRLCGYNPGHHVYIDMNNPEDNDYGKMSIHLDSSHWGTFARSWNIMVSQIECGKPFTPPPGCGQYFWGNNGVGIVMAFNYEQSNPDYYAKLFGIHTICIRREAGMCKISYTPPDYDDDNYGFTVSGKPSLTKGRKSCMRKDPTITGECTDDFISISGGSVNGDTTSADLLLSPVMASDSQYNTCDRFCGRKLCNSHNACQSPLGHNTVTSKRFPFEIRVVLSEHATTNVLKGYKLNYWQTKC